MTEIKKEDERVGELENKIAELEQTIRVMKDDLIHDSLTGLKTRRFFEQEAGMYFKTISEKYKQERREWFGFKHMSIIFFDIDHFKKINDTHGHAAGDGVLRVVAKNIMDGIRAGDIAARWGGEEIVVALLGVGEKNAYKKAEAIRKSIELLSFNNLPNVEVTVSAGVASQDAETGFQEIISRADQALYQAKETGRNKVIFWSLGHSMSK